MNRRHLDLLQCPECQGALAFGEITDEDANGIVEGALACSDCERRYPIRSRIPVFVDDSDYADSFGWQWNEFAHIQRDSYTRCDMVRNTILRRTAWTPGDLAGRMLLECGCGSGNDTEVLSTLAGTVVSIDLSTAVFAQSKEVLERPNVLVLQADLRKPPVRHETFDFVYCHRVIQHTPDPRAAFASMVPFVKPGGTFYLHSYSSNLKSMLQFKYWLRPLISWMPHPWIYSALRRIGPVLHPIVGVLNRFRPLEFFARAVIPFKNHERILADAGAQLTPDERYQFSLLVTFDALTPEHDHPNSYGTIEDWFRQEGFEQIVTNARSPVSVVGVRTRPSQTP